MKIGQKDKIALGGAGVAVVLYFVLQFVLFPAWDALQEKGSHLPDEETKLGKYRQIAQTANLRSAEATAVEAKLREAEGGLLASKTAALASAEMQQLVRQLTAAESIDLRSSDFLPAKSLSADYTVVPVGLQFQCRLDQLVALLRDIGEGPKYVAVPRLLIQAVGSKEKVLSISLQIAGIMRAEPPQKEGTK
jgi:type II secretion system (T2SS) protein M